MSAFLSVSVRVFFPCNPRIDHYFLSELVGDQIRSLLGGEGTCWDAAGFKLTTSRPAVQIQSLLKAEVIKERAYGEPREYMWWEMIVGRKCSHDQPGQSREERGTWNSSLCWAKAFQSSHEPQPWGWVTLDGSLTLCGPQFPPYVKARVELGNCEALLSTSTQHGSTLAGNRRHTV